MLFFLTIFDQLKKVDISERAIQGTFLSSLPSGISDTRKKLKLCVGRTNEYSCTFLFSQVSSIRTQTNIHLFERNSWKKTKNLSYNVEMLEISSVPTTTDKHTNNDHKM